MKKKSLKLLFRKKMSFKNTHLLFIVLLFLSTVSLYAQEKRVSGRVLDEQGELMIGVTVIEKDSSPMNGTTTDVDGNYAIKVSSSSSVLSFTYIGYETKEVKVGNDNVIDVKMGENVNELDEVMVVAFGTQKKTDLIGSVTSVKPSELKAPTSNLTQMLAGQAAGIISYQRTGEPGQDDANFFVRGITTFGAGKRDPLILIDGMELTTSELSRLRPDDIESFSIFKDATSTALYGARGANGVISVTTKQGKEGKPRISARAEMSISSPTMDIEFADPVSYMKLYNEALIARDPFEIPIYTQEKIDMTAAGVNPIIFPATDWKNILFKDNTMNQRYDFNISGGGSVATYYVSASYTQDNGALNVDKMNNFNNNIDLKKYTLRANVNINLSKTSELIVRMNGNFDDYTGPLGGAESVYNEVVRTSPVDFPAYYPIDEKHKHVQHIMFGGLRDRSYRNPYANMVKGYRESDRSMMMAQLEYKQDLGFLLKGLKFRTLINTNRTSLYQIERSYSPFYYDLTYFDRRTGEYDIEVINPTTGKEFLDFSIGGRSQSSVVYSESAINYNNTFNEKHDVSGMLVTILRNNTDAQGNTLQLTLPSRNVGLSGRSTYAYDKRYFVEFNFGYNGSERFHESKRFGFFPSFGLAWTISNEKFWEPITDVVNNFRIRGTFGLVGNDQIGAATDRFFYLSDVNMSSTGYTFGRESNYTRPGVSVRRYENADISWEVSRKLNFALEMGLFNEWNIQADLFSERRTNILMNRADIPNTMGLTADVQANVGEASSRGFEISTDYSHYFTKDLWTQIRGNFTYATNKYEVYEEPVYEKEWWKLRVGYPIGQPRGYIAERLFVDDDEVRNSPSQNFGGLPNIAGDIKYKDVNGDGEITSLDQVPIGFPLTPEIIYGGGVSLGYKAFDISAFFQGSARSSFWMGGDGPSVVEPFVDGKNILKVFADDHYSLDNQNIYSLWPRLSTERQVNNTQLSTWWLNDGSFLRLKTAEMGFNFPRKLIEKYNVQSFRIYLSGSNLLLWSKFKLWDVEMGGNGLGYPLQRVYNVGVNITF